MWKSDLSFVKCPSAAVLSVCTPRAKSDQHPGVCRTDTRFPDSSRASGSSIWQRTGRNTHSFQSKRRCSRLLLPSGPRTAQFDRTLNSFHMKTSSGSDIPGSSPTSVVISCLADVSCNSCYLPLGFFFVVVVAVQLFP